ncbi:MAG: hypothetical protein V3W19_17325, partial [Desulfatiglandales bacterium]
MGELESRLELARRDLRISEATEARIASELEQLKKSGNASDEILADYEIYLGRVQEMVLENRNIVQKMEALYARYAPRRESPGGSASADPSNVPGPKLPDEKEGDELSALDHELNDSLAAFDEMLLKELDEIRSRSANKMKDLAEAAAAAAQRLREKGVEVDTSSPEATSDAREGEADSEGGKTHPEEGGAEPQVAAEESQQAESGGEGKGQTSTQQQRSRPSGHDDDIVARQIREAAEKETDPELKEKLWK